MPQAELTEEEKKLNFKPCTVNDITAPLLNSTFHLFCMPEKEEGFDEVRYVWQNEAKSKEYLKKWVSEKKVTSRIEDLTPSEAFQTRLAEFKKTMQEMQAKQKEFKSSKADAETEKKAAEGEEKPEGEEEEKEETETKAMDVDIFSVENVNDVGNGEPLFSNFTFEDWALLTLRYELHLLQAAFRDDVKDPERIGIHENHLLFYYSRYFKKQLSPTLYGKETPQDVVELVKDVVTIDAEKKVLASVLTEEPEGLVAFVKMQEQNRRKREQRIDAGDETARLNFSLLQQQGSYGYAHGGGGKGGWRSKGSQAAAGAAVAAVAAPGGTAAPPGPPGGPRLVPAPRSKNWQGQKGGWQSGKAGAGRTPQTYAPRMPGKAGKKG
uniref:Uncharacterized protein n=1 Tax=Alexandrium monilatum TaxID=311494 RepID=A0A7S4QTC1_9DINO